MADNMTRILIFLSMFLFSLIDIGWALFNLFQAGALYLLGSLFEIWRLKELGRLTKLYGRNIALSVDQFMATKAMGQDPDVSISMALGVAKIKHENGSARVNGFWILFGRFVNWLFCFEPDHITNAIEKEETSQATVIHLYKDNDEKKAA